MTVGSLGWIMEETNPNNELDLSSADFPLGSIMRGERATMGKSLIDVQNEIRIKADFIDAIENLDPSVFETPGFVSGYVRSYARYLNMDADTVFVRFCDEANFEPPVRLENTSKRTSNKPAGLAGAAFAGHSNLDHERWWERVTPASVASLAVLLGIVGGISFGGYSVLQEVQRVSIAPSTTAPEIVEIGPILNITDEAVALVETSIDENTASSAPTVELFRPQLLDVPVFVPRDGPISLISTSLDAEANGDQLIAGNDTENVPQVTELNLTGVEIFAADAAWISVSSPSQGTLFEQILESNTRYRVPADSIDAVLRAGNSGSVYLIVNGTAFGPVGEATRVAKNVSLLAENIKTAYSSVENPSGYDPAATPVNLAQTN